MLRSRIYRSSNSLTGLNIGDRVVCGGVDDVSQDCTNTCPELVLSCGMLIVLLLLFCRTENISLQFTVYDTFRSIDHWRSTAVMRLQNLLRIDLKMGWQIKWVQVVECCLLVIKFRCSSCRCFEWLLLRLRNVKAPLCLWYLLQFIYKTRAAIHRNIKLRFVTSS